MMNQEQQQQQLMKQRMVAAITHVKNVYESHPQLPACNPEFDFIKDLDSIDPAAADAPIKLKELISKTRNIRLFLDMASVELMKIWDYHGRGLMVLKGDKCFAIVHDVLPPPYVLPPPHEGRILKAHKIHDHLFLCVDGPEEEAFRWFKHALGLDSKHQTNYNNHIRPEKLALELHNISIPDLRSMQCKMVIVGFGDYSEPCIYTLDNSGYRQQQNEFAVIGEQASDISMQCMDLQASTLDPENLFDKAVRAFGAALAGDPDIRYQFRAYSYIVTPKMIDEKRIEGKGNIPGYYLLS